MIREEPAALPAGLPFLVERDQVSGDVVIYVSEGLTRRERREALAAARRQAKAAGREGGAAPSLPPPLLPGKKMAALVSAAATTVWLMPVKPPPGGGHRRRGGTAAVAPPRRRPGPLDPARHPAAGPGAALSRRPAPQGGGRIGTAAARTRRAPGSRPPAQAARGAALRLAATVSIRPPLLP